MYIRFVVCGELTIPHLGLIYYCFYKRKIAMRNLGRPSRSDFVQQGLSKEIRYVKKCPTKPKIKQFQQRFLYIIIRCIMEWKGGSVL